MLQRNGFPFEWGPKCYQSEVGRGGPTGFAGKTLNCIATLARNGLGGRLMSKCYLYLPEVAAIKCEHLAKRRCDVIADAWHFARGVQRTCGSGTRDGTRIFAFDRCTKNFGLVKL